MQSLGCVGDTATGDVLPVAVVTVVVVVVVVVVMIDGRVEKTSGSQSLNCVGTTAICDAFAVVVVMVVVVVVKNPHNVWGPRSSANVGERDSCDLGLTLVCDTSLNYPGRSLIRRTRCRCPTYTLTPLVIVRACHPRTRARLTR